MKKLNLLFSTLLCLCSLTANAHHFEVDGIYYNITDATNKTVEVTYKGSTYFDYSNEYTGNVVIPESVTYNGTTYFVTRIGDSAFEECNSLTSIEIPSSVTSIGSCAFTGTTWYNNQPDGVVYAGKVLYKYKGTMSKNTSIIVKEGTLGIAGSAFQSCFGLTSIEIPNSVTSIGKHAFNGCSGLASIEIPNSVTSIGKHAFYACHSLTSIEIPNSVTSIGDATFWYCTGLASVVIGNGVRSIGNSAFKDCDGLTSVIIGNSVISIGDYAFKYCKSLANIEIPNSVTSIGNYAFHNCYSLKSVAIGNSVTSIGDYVFYSCDSLTNVTIGNSVTSIGDYAFYRCGSLTNIKIPNSVTSIGDYAFEYCTKLREVHISDLAAWCGIEFANGAANPLFDAESLYLNGELLTELSIPEGVVEIKKYAFYDYDSLTSIKIPSSVTSIGDYAFGRCKDLTNIIIATGNAKYDSRDNCNAIIETATNTLVVGCKNTSIPNSVTSIGEYAFFACSGLTSIVIPGSVTSIGGKAFSGCIDLTDITIPNSVTSIGSSAFYHCTGLTSIEIPNSVTSIEQSTFNYCDRLTNVVIGNNVTSIKPGAFEYCTGLTSIVIPNSVVDIHSYAFRCCSGLTNVTIGSGVKNIYSDAFAKCENLTDVYCLATSAPSASSNAFNESYPEYMTLHVPEEAINSYKATAPWSSFGTVVTLDGEDIIEPEVKICAMPTVSYSDGKLHFECETEGAEFVTEITSSDFNKFYNNDINLTATYNISVYATATGYENSDIVNATLCWIECDCNADDTSIINIPAKAALVTSNGGVLSISCQLDGEEVAVYTTAGTLIATTAIENGAATVATGLSKGTVAIVKIADKSIKVIVD